MTRRCALCLTLTEGRPLCSACLLVLYPPRTPASGPSTESRGNTL